MDSEESHDSVNSNIESPETSSSNETMNVDGTLNADDSVDLASSSSEDGTTWQPWNYARELRPPKRAAAGGRSTTQRIRSEKRKNTTPTSSAAPRAKRSRTTSGGDGVDSSSECSDELPSPGSRARTPSADRSMANIESIPSDTSDDIRRTWVQPMDVRRRNGPSTSAPEFRACMPPRGSDDDDDDDAEDDEHDGSTDTSQRCRRCLRKFSNGKCFESDDSA